MEAAVENRYSFGAGVDDCGPTCCASAAAEARGTDDFKKGTISRAEGGQLQALVRRRRRSGYLVISIVIRHAAGVDEEALLYMFV